MRVVVRVVAMLVYLCSIRSSVVFSTILLYSQYLFISRQCRRYRPVVCVVSARVCRTTPQCLKYHPSVSVVSVGRQCVVLVHRTRGVCSSSRQCVVSVCGSTRPCSASSWYQSVRSVGRWRWFTDRGSPAAQCSSGECSPLVFCSGIVSGTSPKTTAAVCDLGDGSTGLCCRRDPVQGTSRRPTPSDCRGPAGAQPAAAAPLVVRRAGHVWWRALKCMS